MPAVTPVNIHLLGLEENEYELQGRARALIYIRAPIKLSLTNREMQLTAQCAFFFENLILISIQSQMRMEANNPNKGSISAHQERLGYIL